MRYFPDEKIKEMRDAIREYYNGSGDGMMYLAYVSELEALDKRNDEYGDCKEQLFQMMSELNRFSSQYVHHRGKADVNDKDADAYEYENYDFRQNGD